MLVKNIWQKKGLYNGTLGTVRGFVFREGVKPPSLPICVLVEFDEYCGPSITPHFEKVVPIVTEVVQFDPRCGITGSREQLPLILGWAMTIHKSQGLTLNRAVLGLGDREMATGLTYVGCSRMKSFRGLAFDSSSPWERFEKINQSRNMRIIRAEMARLNALMDAR
jgi:ATP-dependent DNA helicase PIF1